MYSAEAKAKAVITVISGERVEQIKAKLSFADSLIDKFKNGDLKTRRGLLSGIGSNHTLKDRKLYVSIEKPLLLLKELKNREVSDRIGLEPENTLQTKDILSEMLL